MFDFGSTLKMGCFPCFFAHNLIDFGVDTGHSVKIDSDLCYFVNDCFD